MHLVAKEYLFAYVCAIDYVRSMLCATFACWFRSGTVLTFDQFYHSSFF